MGAKIHLLLDALRLLQVTFPNGVFSGSIISSVVQDGDIKRTAEWLLLLGAISLPGVFVGAALCNRLGRKYTVSIASECRICMTSITNTKIDDAWVQWIPCVR